MVWEDGEIVRHEVAWAADEFKVPREVADCSDEAAIKKHRCGVLFADLQEALVLWPGEHASERIRAFPAPFKDHRTRG